ncbi:hypothetical protein WA026_019198 [Henosepilachna vigintioctopunctata]|uniref:Nose resistant-to-fluoxetine protein N-terminal domain-containing protein n=1 Tax=Henosepilachna vigintioctopunctata TaxID=420089 RepID=A0AAW1V1M3_9CUCU
MKIYLIILSLLLCEVIANFENECSNKVLTLINTGKIGYKCSDQLKILCQRHDILFTLWDASSKLIRTGLTAASNYDLGNFDLCMTIDTRINDTKILGKFCPNQWSTLIDEKKLEDFIALLEFSPHSALSTEDGIRKTNKETTSDDSKNITLLGSVCIPDSCSAEEFNAIFRPYLYPVTPVDKVDCVTKYTRRDFTVSDWIIAFALGLVVLIILCCTVVDIFYYYKKEDKINELIVGCSAFSNGRKLFSVNTDKINQIQCMNGLRFLSILWIIAYHTFLTVNFKPLMNQKDFFNWQKQLYSQYILSGYIAVDTFFFLSGFLLTYGYLKQVENKSILQQISGIPSMYLYRYLRLTPALGAMYLVSISFLRLIGNGPLWFHYYDVNQIPCTQNWWRFFLYIQNYYSGEMCYVQTWYLSADMQMFVFSPLVLILIAKYLKKEKKYLIWILICLVLIFVLITVIVPYSSNDFVDNYDTHSRVRKRIKINKVMNIILWIVSLAAMTFVLYCNYYVTEYNHTKLDYTLYSGLYRPIWCTCIFWIVFSCYYGYGGFVNWFLSNSLFQIGGKLSYCMYVLHAMILLISFGSVRSNSYFGDYEMIIVLLGYVNITIILSIFWTLLFEAPMLMLNKKIAGFIGSNRTR